MKEGESFIWFLDLANKKSVCSGSAFMRPMRFMLYSSYTSMDVGMSLVSKILSA